MKINSSLKEKVHPAYVKKRFEPLMKYASENRIRLLDHGYTSLILATFIAMFVKKISNKIFLSTFTGIGTAILMMFLLDKIEHKQNNVNIIC